MTTTAARSAGFLARVPMGALLKGLILGLCAMLLGLAAVQIVSGWQERRALVRLSDLNAATDRLMQAAEQMTNERGLTQTALNAAGAAARPALDAIAARRTAMREAYAAAVAQLRTMHFPQRDTLLDAAAAAVQRVDTLRLAADAAAAQPRDQRDAAVVREWYGAASTAIERMTALWLVAAGSASAVDPAIALLNDIKAYAMTMREYAGRERAAFGGAVAGNAAAVRDRRDDLLDWTARTDMAWRRLQELTGNGRAGDRVAAAMAAVNDGFFARYVPARDAVRTAIAAGQPVATTPAQWTAVSNPALQRIVDVRDAAIAASAAHVERSIDAIVSSLAVQAIVLTCGLILSLIALVAINRQVLAPVRRVTAAMAEVAQGRIDVELDGTERRDEIGSLARSFATFRDTIGAAREQAAREAEEVRARAQRAAEIEALTRQFDAQATAALGSVSSAVDALQDSAASMTSIAEETSRQSAAVAAASDQASTNVTTVATATEELSTSVSEIARQVAQSAAVARRAVAESARSNDTVRGLDEAAQKIGEILRLISDVAGQTNLLALNATIEAARAGEAGKGFAVVANEVKSLATQTARATDEIAAQIGAIQSATKESVAAIAGFGSTIREIDEIAGAIAAAVEEQGTATREIARNIQQAAAGTAEVSGNIGGVTQAAGETGTAASQVKSATDALSREAGSLRENVDRFLAAIRAA